MQASEPVRQPWAIDVDNIEDEYRLGILAMLDPKPPEVRKGLRNYKGRAVRAFHGATLLWYDWYEVLSWSDHDSVRVSSNWPGAFCIYTPPPSLRQQS